MDWLSFVSSLVWPGVAVTALLMFRRNLNHWFSQRPDRIKAGPLEAEWKNNADRVAEELEAGRSGLSSADGGDGRSTEEPAPPEPLSLQLRDRAREVPVLAVLEAWVLVEHELIQVMEERGVAFPIVRGRRPPVQVMVEIAVSEGKLPEWIPPTVESMRKLRNTAAHAASLTSAEAFEFLGLADLVLGELRRELGSG
ncbi:hypothetical protein [Nocardia brasiliensis]|uniref:hypothetical protein n=1 Tax=Nocardia brasiliensis TaxID=37326 RepID=UPI0024540701|nr:hypothetical protein [Nocardia brasiliensis]